MVKLTQLSKDITELRVKMVAVAKEHGRFDKKVLELSQELDEKILEYMLLLKE